MRYYDVLNSQSRQKEASDLKPTEEVRLRALRQGVFAYLAWVPGAGYTWRDDLVPWPPPRPPRTSSAVAPVSGLPRWIERDPTPDPPPYLVGPAPVGVGAYSHPRGVLREGAYRLRNDGQSVGLHRRFADLSGAEQFKAFADRYGALGQGEIHLSQGKGNPMWAGEPLALWEREIAAMGRTLGAWEQRGKADEVRKEVNERLRGHVNPILLPPDVAEGYRIIFRPDSLLAALYVLLALEIAAATESTDASPKVCAYCGEVFTPTRRDQRYCKPSHRSAAHYHRKNAKGVES